MSANAAPVWVLLDTLAGHRAQVLGVAAALGLRAGEVAEKELAYGPLARLPNALLGAGVGGLDAGARAGLTAPWPRLVLAAGRRTAPVARWIKRESGGASRVAQIMDPGAGRGDFDLILTPAHDRLSGDNVVRLSAAPHALTPERLAEAAYGDWPFASLPKPWTAVVVGGSTRRRRFTAAMAAELGGLVAGRVRSTGGAVLATTSRRTDADALAALETALDDVPHHLYRWGDAGENPYLAYLALADEIVVTGESVSMCTEACAMAKPVYLFAPAGLITRKHARLHAALYGGGHARSAKELGADWTPAPPLDPAAEAAEAIRARGLLGD